MLAIILPAVIALVGTLAGILLTYRKWRGDRRDARTADFDHDRRTAYRQLWSIVEDIHVALRVRDLSPSELSEHVATMNTFILKSELYLQPEVHSLTNEYVAALRRWADAIEQSHDDEAQTARHSTAALPPEVLTRAHEIATAQHRVDGLRQQLMGIVQAELQR